MRVGPFELVTAPPEVVRALSCSAEERTVLLEIGLPRRSIVPGLTFDLVDVLPFPATVFEGVDFHFGEAWKSVRLLGGGSYEAIFVNLSDAGSVWRVDFTQPKDALFVNSNVVALCAVPGRGSRCAA